jgi:hypothetical protein
MRRYQKSPWLFLNVHCWLWTNTVASVGLVSTRSRRKIMGTREELELV